MTRTTGNERYPKCPGLESPCSGYLYGQADYCYGCISTRRVLATMSRRPGTGMPDDDPPGPDPLPLLLGDDIREGRSPNAWDSPRWEAVRRAPVVEA